MLTATDPGPAVPRDPEMGPNSHLVDVEIRLALPAARASVAHPREIRVRFLRGRNPLESKAASRRAGDTHATRWICPVFWHQEAPDTLLTCRPVWSVFRELQLLPRRQGRARRRVS